MLARLTTDALAVVCCCSCSWLVLLAQLALALLPMIALRDTSQNPALCPDILGLCALARRSLYARAFGMPLRAKPLHPHRSTKMSSAQQSHKPVDQIHAAHPAAALKKHLLRPQNRQATFETRFWLGQIAVTKGPSALYKLLCSRE